MQEDLSERRPEKKSVASQMRGWPLTLLALAAASACAIYAHEEGVTNVWAFLGLTALTGAALSFITLMLDIWFGRPTNGTSGGIGMLYLWAIGRILATAVIVACAFAGAASYAGAYLATIIVCGILDAVYIFTSL